ncbi:MAG: hypothetical protein Q7T74_00665 [Candidatus Saccharibacteria bacterium]|nr:hypothetical protein [Candidatus Saccharibacteria bacterium]
MNDALGILAIAIGLVGYIPYFRTIFSGKTKPHAFTWLVWGVLTGIAFIGQIAGGGGAGAWVTGFTAFISFSIFGLALVKGKRDFPLVDWLCLGGCVLALALWAVTNNPLSAIILITIIDALAFAPTFRKSYSKPYSEPIFTYAMSCLKFLIALFALQELSAVTVLYPASLVIANGAFMLLLIVQRNRLGTRQKGVL